MLIDTHSHIYLQEFDFDKTQILQRAAGESIEKILLPAIDSSTHQRMLDLEKDSGTICVSMMGVHPCSVNENYKQELKIARSYIDSRGFIAVGEIGLDFYWDKTFTEQQYKVFNEQIRWGAELNLPIVIHSRNSIDECIEVISEHQNGNLNGVFHCFSGNEEHAKKVIDLGFYLGIGGVVTFKNSGLDKVVSSINLDNIVLETDAPYLSPVPFRGKRNEPSYLKYVVNKIAELKQLNRETVEEITTENAKKLFKL